MDLYSMCSASTQALTEHLATNRDSSGWLKTVLWHRSLRRASQTSHLACRHLLAETTTFGEDRQADVVWCWADSFTSPPAPSNAKVCFKVAPVHIRRLPQKYLTSQFDVRTAGT